MLKFWRFLLVLAVLAAFPLTGVLAKEVVQVTITGPGLNTAVELVEADALAVFQAVRFDEGMITLPPTDAAGPHFEVRASVGVGDQIVATNVEYYYFTPDSSYMYFADVEGGWSDAEGTWFRLSPESDRALRALLMAEGAAIERTSQPAAGPLWKLLLSLFG